MIVFLSDIASGVLQRRGFAFASRTGMRHAAKMLVALFNARRINDNG